MSARLLQQPAMILIAVVVGIALWELAARPVVLPAILPARADNNNHHQNQHQQQQQRQWDQPSATEVGSAPPADVPMSPRPAQLSPIVAQLIANGSLTDARTLARPEDAGYFSPVANAPRSDNPIAEFFLTTQGRIVFKWLHYLDIYYRHLSRFRNMGRPIHVMEIGLFCGGSLQMWRSFFGPDAYIYGVDMLSKRRFAEERTRIIKGDQGSMKFWQEVKRTIPKLDIIIDDGGHLPEQQRNTFKALFDHLQPDGVYMVEDLHTSYMADYQGGIGRPGTFVEYSKQFIDALHCSFTSECSKELLGWHAALASTTFYDSVLVMEKRPHPAPVSVMRGVGDDKKCWKQDPR
jgi:hypothetical protein